MRKIFKSAFAGFAILCSTSLTSCSNEIPETTENDKDNLVTISSITVPLYINDSNTPNTRTSYEDDEANGVIKVKWVLEDVIYVGVPTDGGESGQTVDITDQSSGFKAYKVSSIDESGKTATFTPSAEDEAYSGTAGTNVLAYYSSGIKVNTKHQQITYDFKKQSVHGNDNLKFLHESDLMRASSTIQEDGTLGDFKFEHEFGFIKLKMTNITTLDGTTEKWKNININVSGEGNSFNKYKYKYKNSEVAYEASSTSISITINYIKTNATTLDAFFAIVPTTFSQNADSKMEIILTDESGNKQMSYALKPGAAIEKGKCYTINAPMETITTASEQTAE